MGERDWVAVSEEGTEAGWGRDGKGVGIVALLSTIVTFVSDPSFNQKHS
jgi:hypothetical protein